jgi:hypothetical protein
MLSRYPSGEWTAENGAEQAGLAPVAQPSFDGLEYAAYENDDYHDDDAFGHFGGLLGSQQPGQNYFGQYPLAGSHGSVGTSTNPYGNPYVAQTYPPYAQWAQAGTSASAGLSSLASSSGLANTFGAVSAGQIGGVQMEQGGVGAGFAPADDFMAQLASEDFEFAAVAKQEDGGEASFFDDANFEFDDGELPVGFQQ